MKPCYQCEKCGGIYSRQVDAERCETTHFPIKEVKVLLWTSRQRFHGYSGAFPENIKVKIEAPPDFGHDWAVYKLERIGPRAL